MKSIIDAILSINPEAKVSVNAENFEQITWHDGNPNNITKADIEAKLVDIPTTEEKEENEKNLKASAKAKLIAGQPLTEEEADTIVL